MTLKKSYLIKDYRFEWKSGSLGSLLVHNLTVSVSSMLNKRFKSYSDADSREFVRVLITAVCQLDLNNNGEYNDDRVSYEQVKYIDDDELNDFAERFLDKNAYLKKDYSKRKKTGKIKRM